MKKSKWIKQFSIERYSQARWSNLNTRLNMTCTVLSIAALSAYTVYLLRAMGYKCKATQDLKLANAIFNPRVVDKDMKAWKAKVRDAFGIDAIPIVNTTMEQLHGDALLMEEKAPIPSRH